MASSINLGYCAWLTGGTYTETLLNQILNGGIFYNDESTTNHPLSGVLPSGNGLAVGTSSGMTISVGGGGAVVPVTGSSTNGSYLVSNPSAATLTVTTASPINPRIDLVCITVSDVGTSSSYAYAQIITGTASTSPAAPSLPGYSIPLAYVSVAANATSITSGNISDQRKFTVCEGGVLPVTASGAPLGYTGAYIHDLTSGSLKQNLATGVAQARVLPYAPQQVTLTSGGGSTATSGTQVTAGNLTFTADGVTNFEYYASWPGLWSSTGTVSFYADVSISIDGTIIKEILVQNTLGISVGGGGGCLSHFTTTAAGDTPVNGTHTMKLSFTPFFTGSTTVSMNLTSTRSVVLRVVPVGL